MVVAAATCISAESKAEADLKARLALAQKALADSASEKKVLAEALGKVAPTVAASSAKTVKALKSVAQDQLLNATDAAIAAEATARKLADAEAAQAQAAREIAAAAKS